MKNITVNFLSFMDVPIGLSFFGETKVVPLRLFDLKNDTSPKYSIYYDDSRIK